MNKNIKNMKKNLNMNNINNYSYTVRPVQTKHLLTNVFDINRQVTSTTNSDILTIFKVRFIQCSVKTGLVVYACHIL